MPRGSRYLIINGELGLKDHDYYMAFGAQVLNTWVSGPSGLYWFLAKGAMYDILQKIQKMRLVYLFRRLQYVAYWRRRDLIQQLLGCLQVLRR